MPVPKGENTESNQTKEPIDHFDYATRIAGYAVKATGDIRDSMIDPTSFTLLQVISIAKQEKNGKMSFRGCVHYVGSNRMGGREQAWGGYSVDKTGYKVKSWPGVASEYGGCLIEKNEKQTDVTALVKEHLSEPK